MTTVLPLVVGSMMFALGWVIVARVAEPMIRRHLDRWSA